MENPSHIQILPVHVANKIAAGEVVERPASVVKELIENSVDAGASQVEIDIVRGGRRLVAVRDNGSGMNRDDTLLCVERLATSKIRDVDDIEKIETLGFRGEALAAIASVSRFRLQTCATGQTLGTELLMTGGKLRDVRDAGCPSGTTVEVRDLFFNIPARRKFLRSYQTEQSHIRSCFIVQALAHPGVGLRLKSDGREVYNLPGGARLDDRLLGLFGSDYRKNLLEVNYSGPEVKVSGYASVPAMSRSDRGEQYLFVNGRATGAAVLSYALREGYHTLLPDNRQPSVFLFIDVDAGLVDVNVHPAKKEVRFRHPTEVRDAVIAAVREALGPGRTTQSTPAEAGRTRWQEAGKASAGELLPIEDLPPTRSFRYPRLPSRPAEGWESRQRNGRGTLTDTGPLGEETLRRNSGQPMADSPDSPWTWCRVIGQIGGLYVVLETEDGFVLMDPHAAHERVLFERFMSDLLDGKVQSQSLLIPETVELRPGDGLRVRKNLAVFKEMGFGISEFGGDALVVDSVPAAFAGASAEALLVEASRFIEQAGARGGKGRWREESIAQAACKSAVKARERLTLEEIEKLVVDLAGCEMPYTCPHGRPTLIFTSFAELNKKFGRESGTRGRAVDSEQRADREDGRMNKSG